MTKDGVFAILKLQPDASEEDILEALQQKLFEVKHYLLQMVVVPRIYQTRLRTVKQVYDMMKVLEMVDVTFEASTIEYPSINSSLVDLGLTKSDDWSLFLSNYESKLVQAKGQLSMSLTPVAMSSALQELISIQLAFDAVIKSQFSLVPQFSEEETPRQQDQIGSVAIRNIFKEHNLLDTSVSEPILSDSWNSLTEEEQRLCYKEWLRCSKGFELWK